MAVYDARSMRNKPHLPWLGLTLVALLGLSGCAESTGVAAPQAVEPVFVEVGAAAGLTFRHVTGAFGKKYLPETMGSGCAWLDYDVDGWIDLFLVNSMYWPEDATGGGPSRPALYRNLGDGRFEDVTQAAGLADESYGMGVAVGDYDNDGKPDLYLTALGRDRLYRNVGQGRFEETTGFAGIDDDEYSTSATFLDYDRDGWLDLFVTHYVEWSAATDLFCTLDGVNKSYCTPESYPGTTNRMYRNLGDGRFEDVTESAGLHRDVGKALGVIVYDHDFDGWPDIAVANDTVRTFLYRNNGTGSFSEIGRDVGIAFSENGEARAGMGIDAADIDGSGRESIAIGNFSAESVALYRSRGLEAYSDDASASGIGMASYWTLAFGTFFFDYDADGWMDLFVANGHVEPDVNRVQSEVHYAQPPHLFHNRGDGSFEDLSPEKQPALSEPMVARGAAYADFDRDGDLDFVVTTNGGPARLFRNDGLSGNGWLRVDLVGSDSARDALGARLVLRLGSQRLLRTRRGASSYLSQSEPTVTFGLGSLDPGDLEVTWPSGLRQTFAGLPRNASITLVEGEAAFRVRSD